MRRHQIRAHTRQIRTFAERLPQSPDTCFGRRVDGEQRDAEVGDVGGDEDELFVRFGEGFWRSSGGAEVVDCEERGVVGSC